MTESRPDLTLPRSRAERVLEGVALLSLLVALAIVAFRWSTLPESVPRHFGSGGLPDAYGPRGTIVTPVVGGLVTYLLLSVVQVIPPRLYNFPVRITAQNAEAQYRAARALLATLKAGLSILFASLTWLMVQVALGQRQGLGGLFLPATLLVALGPLAWFGVKAYRQRAA